MDHTKTKFLVAALATAFAGAAFAADSPVTASDPTKGTPSNPATSYDTGKTAPFSGAEGVQTTPSASDEDHNDNGGARGKHHSLPHRSSKDAPASTAAQPQGQPVQSSAGTTGGNASPAGVDGNQQKSSNGQ